MRMSYIQWQSKKSPSIILQIRSDELKQNFWKISENILLTFESFVFQGEETKSKLLYIENWAIVEPN